MERGLNVNVWALRTVRALNYVNASDVIRNVSHRYIYIFACILVSCVFCACDVTSAKPQNTWPISKRRRTCPSIHAHTDTNIHTYIYLNMYKYAFTYNFDSWAKISVPHTNHAIFSRFKCSYEIFADLSLFYWVWPTFELAMRHAPIYSIIPITFPVFGLTQKSIIHPRQAEGQCI